MRENCTTLYPNAVVAQKVSDYAISHSISLPEELTKYHEWVLKSQPRSYFAISPLEARFLIWLTRTVGAKRGTYRNRNMPFRMLTINVPPVLEIGAFVGFSVAVWAYAVGPHGKVTGLEKSSQYARLGREQLKKFGWTNTELVEGDALET
jgi:protein-L-isoaspartate O-methyltransferase